MSTAACPPAPIALYRPWWQRLFEEIRAARDERRRRDAERDLFDSLSGLSEGTLRDIGAPDWIHERDRGITLRELERHQW